MEGFILYKALPYPQANLNSRFEWTGPVIFEVMFSWGGGGVGFFSAPEYNF